MRMRKRNAERKKKGVKVENLIDNKSTDKVDLLGSEMRMSTAIRGLFSTRS